MNNASKTNPAGAASTTTEAGAAEATRSAEAEAAQTGTAAAAGATPATESNDSPTVGDILAHNQAFVERGDYQQYTTDKYPDKKLAVVSCMDTRLTELLPAALGLKNGDAKIIKVAGAEVSHPFGSVMRSLLIAVCELGVEDIWVVAHTNCGAQHMSGDDMIEHMQRLGVPSQNIDFARHCGIDFDHWLAGFGDTEAAVRESVNMIRNHPLMPKQVRVAGFIMDSETGGLEEVIDES